MTGKTFITELSFIENLVKVAKNFTSNFPCEKQNAGEFPGYT